MKKAPLFIALTLFAITARATPVTFTDNSFKLSNYSETSAFKSNPNDKVSFSQCPHCGHPGQALHIQMRLGTKQSQDFDAIGFVNNTFSYDPLTEGAIRRIDASVNKNIISNVPPAPAGQFYTNTFRPLIEQDGMFYLAAISGPTYTHGGPTGYNTISQSSLIATDFTEFNFSTGTFGTAHPDFAGDPMLFGLGQLSTFGPPRINFRANYDNLSFTIRPVPDSGSTAFLFSGSAGLLFLCLRNQRQRV